MSSLKSISFILVVVTLIGCQTKESVAEEKQYACKDQSAATLNWRQESMKGNMNSKERYIKELMSFLCQNI